MKKTITQSEFINEFMECRPNNFSYKGLMALFEFLEEWESETGEEIELDVIAICCDFMEDSLDNIKDYYNIPEDEEVMEWLEYRTMVIPVNDENVIIQVF